MTEDSSSLVSARQEHASTFLDKAVQPCWLIDFGCVSVAAGGSCLATWVVSVVAGRIAGEVGCRRQEMQVLAWGSRGNELPRATIAVKEVSAVPMVSSFAQPKDWIESAALQFVLAEVPLRTSV